MKTVDATFQNLDSSEISLTDVSHYFDSDPTKLVQGLRGDGRTPSSYIADTTTANAQVSYQQAPSRVRSRSYHSLTSALILLVQPVCKTVLAMLSTSARLPQRLCCCDTATVGMQFGMELKPSKSNLPVCRMYSPRKH